MQVRRIATFSTVLLAATALGATAVFVPTGTTTVPPGSGVAFDVFVNVGSLTSFDAADVVIGASDGSGISFEYSPEWDAAFQNKTTPVVGLGFYVHDVFVGGNNPSNVGASLKLGTITVSTAGLAEGSYTVEINSVKDGGISKLSRGDLRDALSGSATFVVQCVTADVECDGDVDLADYREFRLCLGAPAQPASAACIHWDTDGDSDVDLTDTRELLNSFTGNR